MIKGIKKRVRSDNELKEERIEPSFYICLENRSIQNSEVIEEHWSTLAWLATHSTQPFCGVGCQQCPD
jgi:hypothetical protein